MGTPMTNQTRAQARMEKRVLEKLDEGDLEGIEHELERWQETRCGARTKTRGGRPCRSRALANGRCRHHGGLSSGPKTIVGRVHGLLNLRQFQHLKNEPPEVILAALGHLLVRPHKEPSRKPPKTRPRPRKPGPVELARALFGGGRQ